MYYMCVFCLLYVFVYFLNFLSPSGLDASQRQGLLLLFIIVVFFFLFFFLVFSFHWTSTWLIVDTQ